MYRDHALPKRFVFATVLLVCGLLTNCEKESVPTPPLEQPPWATGIRQAVGKTLLDVQTARAQNRGNVEAVETSLQDAEKKLERLTEYDLLLQQAAETCGVAYRSAALGEKAEADRQLKEVEALLLRIAEGRGEGVAPEFERPVKLVGEIRLAVETSASLPTKQFESLLQLLNQMSLKGSLVLANER